MCLPHAKGSVRPPGRKVSAENPSGHLPERIFAGARLGKQRPLSHGKVLQPLSDPVPGITPNCHPGVVLRVTVPLSPSSVRAVPTGRL